MRIDPTVPLPSNIDGIPSHKRQITPTARISCTDNNIWQWIGAVGEESPVQPLLNLGTGFNEQKPPKFLLEKLSQCLDDAGNHQYAPISGLPKLKQAISDVYSPLLGRKLDPEAEILIGSGAQEALLASTMAYLGPGDEAVLLEPTFAMYEYQVKYSGADIVYIPIHPPACANQETVSGNDWTLNMAELEVALARPRVKAFVLNNPQNPLGKVFTRDELLAIGNLCVKYNVLLLSDEVYERVIFNDERLVDDHAHPHIRTASLSPEIASVTLTAISLGKLFNATGWRLGFVAGPAELIKNVAAAHLITAYASTTLLQEACASALIEAENQGWFADNNRDIESRVVKLCSIFDEVGLKIPADYQFPEFITKYHNSMDFRACYFLIQEYGISTIPGSSFYGPQNAATGEKYLRFGACKSDENLELVRERLLRLRPLVT